MLRLFHFRHKEPRAPTYFIHVIGLKPVPATEDVAEGVKNILRQAEGAAPTIQLSWDDGIHLCVSVRHIIAVTTEEGKRRFTPASVMASSGAQFEVALKV